MYCLMLDPGLVIRCSSQLLFIYNQITVSLFYSIFNLSTRFLNLLVIRIYFSLLRPRRHQVFPLPTRVRLHTLHDGTFDQYCSRVMGRLYFVLVFTSVLTHIYLVLSFRKVVWGLRIPGFPNPETSMRPQKCIS